MYKNEEDDHTIKKQFKLLNWWYKKTSLPEIDGGTFQERERIRKSRFLSVMVICLVIIFLFFIPGCLVLPNKNVIIVDFVMLPISGIALLFNRKGYPTVAGMLLTISFESCLCCVVLTSLPFDPPSLQQYELFVFGELLAVSLISPRSVIAVALFNSIFICCTVIWMPATPEFAKDIQQQLIALLLRPLSVQWLVAPATYLWARSTASALRRADRAETIAKLQEDLAWERARVEQEKTRLEQQINHIVNNYVQSINSHDHSHAIPFQADLKVLWPLVNVIDALRKRLISAQRDQITLQQYQDRIHFIIDQLQRKKSFASISQTGIVDIDMLCHLLLQYAQS